jgi:hypothetical protein
VVVCSRRTCRRELARWWSLVNGQWERRKDETFSLALLLTSERYGVWIFHRQSDKSDGGGGGGSGLPIPRGTLNVAL